jgi:hypothetical protein
MNGMVKWSAGWPGANVNVGNIGWVWVGFYYLAVVILLKKKKSETVV